MLYKIDAFFLIPIIICGIYAQIQINYTMLKYSKIRSCTGLTGESMARKILDKKDLYHIRVEQGNGFLSDQYHFRKKTVVLSRLVFDEKSIVAIAVAAHQCGHGTQETKKVKVLKIQALFNLIIRILWKCVGIFLVMGIFVSPIFVQAGIGAYVLIFCLKIALLPMEFDASKRAFQILKESEVMVSEHNSIKKVLYSVALTQVASLIGGCSNLVRLFFVDKEKKDSNKKLQKKRV